MTAEDILSPLERLPNGHLRCGRCSAEFSGETINKLIEALQQIEKCSHKGAPKTETIIPGCAGCIARATLAALDPHH